MGMIVRPAELDAAGGIWQLLSTHFFWGQQGHAGRIALILLHEHITDGALCTLQWLWSMSQVAAMLRAL